MTTIPLKQKQYTSIEPQNLNLEKLGAKTNIKKKDEEEDIVEILSEKPVKGIGINEDDLMEFDQNMDY